MKKVSVKLLVLVLVIGAVLLLLIPIARAVSIDVPPQPAIGRHELLEWDGTKLTTRMVPFFSETERQQLAEWNEMTRAWAKSADGSGQGQTPQLSVIDTEYGQVTVETMVSDTPSVTLASTAPVVEIDEVQTPYGLLTIEKHSYGESVAQPSAPSSSAPPLPQTDSLSEYSDSLYATCGSSGVEFNFGSNQTLSNYQLYWSGGNYSDYVSCYATTCTFKVTTSWSAYYTYGRAYTAPPGYVYGFGFNDYRCR